MQALLLAAGQSSRMYPFANGMHKSMIRLMGKPLLQHTIAKLKLKNITEVVIVVGKDNNIEKYFGNGEKFGVSIKYVLQEKPEGAGSAILLAKEHLQDEFLLLNSYHVEIDKLVDQLLSAKQETDGTLLVRQKEDTSDFGVVTVDGNKVKAITEKPPKGKEESNLCIVGIYLLSKSFLTELENTPFDHYQLETALDAFSKKHTVCFVETKEETVVLKYPWDLLGIKNYLLKDLQKNIAESAEIASSAEIIGQVQISENVKVMEKVVIKGPCFIGKNVFIGNNAVLRNGVIVEENSVIGANAEVKNSVIMADSKTHSGFIGDSVIGKNCRIAAGFCTANVRLDRETVKATVKGEKVDTGLKSLGVMIGDETHFGIKSSTMPGIIIGRNVVVGSETTVMNNIDDNTKYYTKFQEVVVKQ